MIWILSVGSLYIASHHVCVWFIDNEKASTNVSRFLKIYVETNRKVLSNLKTTLKIITALILIASGLTILGFGFAEDNSPLMVLGAVLATYGIFLTKRTNIGSISQESEQFKKSRCADFFSWGISSVKRIYNSHTVNERLLIGSTIVSVSTELVLIAFLPHALLDGLLIVTILSSVFWILFIHDNIYGDRLNHGKYLLGGVLFTLSVFMVPLLEAFSSLANLKGESTSVLDFIATLVNLFLTYLYLQFAAPIVTVFGATNLLITVLAARQFWSVSQVQPSRRTKPQIIEMEAD